MELINKNRPIEVDFNNADEDYAVRLHLPDIEKNLKEEGIVLSEGQKIWMTDGDVEEIGTLEFRDGIWVAVPIKETLKNVDVSAPYHNENAKLKK